ncbi:hypothetical protein VDF96_03470, partial [Xanthomonas campestris pv. raphani]|uniref:hypothetical protein n=3 Tax=Xanthomonas campestris TaxID=339 RepID=UPI002B22AE79
GVGTQLHGDRLDPGSDGGPRRLSTPTLTETEQIRRFVGIHAAKAPATVSGQGPVEDVGVPGCKQKQE